MSYVEYIILYLLLYYDKFQNKVLNHDIETTIMNLIDII